MFEKIPHSNRLFVVAGPCSAESYAQMETVASRLSANPKIALVRCGVWKPRTRPGGFEGAGEEALKWMADLKNKFPALRFATEVAQPFHVELALRYGVDVLWIGARTSGNPFSISELAESLRGTHVPVMVKSPMVPDLKLWVGAIERLRHAGLSDLAAVHRGFCTNSGTSLRNDPCWEIPIELRRLFPDLPILCDPSHLGGSREMVRPLSQMAINLAFDGLMVECHPNPDEALTDAAQQLSLDELESMLALLSLRDKSHHATADLQLYRDQITSLDGELIRILADRMDLCRKIAEVKNSANMPIYQPRQWDNKLRSCLSQARHFSLDEDFVSDIFQRIHLQSIKVQEESISPNSDALHNN